MLPNTRIRPGSPWRMFLVGSVALCPKAPAAVLDPGAVPHPVLHAVAEDLDQSGIDVVMDPANANRIEWERPRLVPMSPEFRGASSPIEDATWVEPFVFSAVASLGASGDPLSQWGASPAPATGARADASGATRVFLSYSGRDVTVAEAARKTLERQGYSVFTYLRPGMPGPTFDPIVAGRALAEADEVLVLDTPSARTSMGVAVERELRELARAVGSAGEGGPPPASRGLREPMEWSLTGAVSSGIEHLRSTWQDLQIPPPGERPEAPVAGLGPASGSSSASDPLVWIGRLVGAVREAYTRDERLKAEQEAQREAVDAMLADLGVRVDGSQPLTVEGLRRRPLQEQVSIVDIARTSSAASPRWEVARSALRRLDSSHTPVTPDVFLDVLWEAHEATGTARTGERPEAIAAEVVRRVSARYVESEGRRPWLKAPDRLPPESFGRPRSTSLRGR